MKVLMITMKMINEFELFECSSVYSSVTYTLDPDQSPRGKSDAVVTWLLSPCNFLNEILWDNTLNTGRIYRTTNKTLRKDIGPVRTQQQIKRDLRTLISKEFARSFRGM